MIFVDTNVLMYAVGRAHPLRDEARRFFLEHAAPGATPLCSSAEVMQELLHAYLPVGRTETLEASLTLLRSRTCEIWSLEADDVELARGLASRHPALTARDLVHLACCRRRGVKRLMTYDRALAAEVGGDR